MARTAKTPPNDSGDEEAETASSSPRQFVNGFARGLKVIRAFGEGAERLTLTQVAVRAGLTRAGARRLLLTLEELGYASHIGRQYFLTPKVLSLGYAYISSMPLWNIAQPILGRLVQETNETCSLSVLDDTDVVYILRIPVRRILSVGGNVGSRLPAYATSMGRILLGGLPPHEASALLSKVEMVPYTHSTITDAAKLKKVIAQDIERGYSWVDGELEEHICGLSVPVFDADRRIIAALNISFNRPRISRDAMVKKFLPTLRLAADQMSRSMVMREQRLPA
ncbi:MAG: IclR family transcriptional regulator C-terminal domain-containing protein [Reyranellaceae bacterium]